MRAGWLPGLLLVCSTALWANNNAEALIRAEIADAEGRTREDLEARVKDLKQMTHTIDRLTERQAEYIRKLEAQIRALQQEGDGG